MPSERTQRRIDATLDEAEAAFAQRDWALVAELARAILAMDPDNEDAPPLLRAADANLGAPGTTSTPTPDVPAVAAAPAAALAQPESFAAGRYQVRRFLGEGGKKRVFLAHDMLLDRDVAFAVIKTDGLDDVGRERIKREAQAMGRMGSHPNLVSVYDLGDEGGAPFIVTELMAGGDVEGELQKVAGSLPIARTLDIAKGVARGLVFAHGQNVVHRDLKPGNVWLTADGVPKIGDFGLAVARGGSRLTQHGLMVGTFGYMPPEQALGNEATPQSDLYSFGCMLYELVTGLQPFTGDTPTAVISQHLNTAPVAPSWHTEHCPPALEDLILALMAKEPSARPASAKDVLTTLEGIDPSERSRSRSDSAANPLDRLASGVFVGRERELERLRASLDSALAGHGSLVMLVGEPGIGKTRTTQELETYARMRGAKVLWGRAHESAGAPPYWPWTQAARDYREQTPDDELRRRQYQPYAVELQRILPGLRDLFPNLPEPADADSEGGQFRLYDALSSFLRTVATETPLMIVLDDLHWADNATLAMLTHITRELGRARVLVLGTYRDTDLDRRHPLSQALAELNREDLFTRIPLRGLTLAETGAYIRRTADVTPAPALVQRIHEETEGNPFFLSEVVNLMAEEGTLSAAVADVQIPEGVRQALGRRLDRLSEEANALLTTLAVVGREFDHALVLALSPHDAPATLRLVEEALRARVLEETGAAGRYRFRHALMQQTLLEELSAARRVLLHGEIADALLATYGAEDRDHLTALAEHYAESAVLNPVHARLAASTLRRAAEVAADALAWDEAARLYERCLDRVKAAPDRLDEDEGQLQLALALVLFSNWKYSPAWEAFERAVALLGDTSSELASATSQLASILAPPFLRTHLPLWRRLADVYSETPSLEACQMLAVLALADLSAIGADAASRAAAIMATLDIKDARVSAQLAHREPELALMRGDYAAVLVSDIDASRNTIKTTAAMLSGALDSEMRVITEARKVAQGMGNPQQLEVFDVYVARIAWRRDGTQPAREPSAGVAPGPLTRMLESEVALEAAEYERARDLLPADNEPIFGAMNRRYQFLGLRSRVLLALRDRAAARAGCLEYARYDPADTWQFTVSLPGFTDVLLEFGDRNFLETVAAMTESLDQWRDSSSGTGADYLRGAIALKLDRIDDAERWFRIGLEWATKWGLDTIIGRNLYGLAQVEERRGNHLAGMEHLDAAGALFAKRGAKLYLDQVIAMKQVLKA